MGAHSILEWDMEEEPFLLLGIHSTAEPYRMAFLINKYLNVSFKREVRDQDINLQEYIAHFPVYRHEDLVNNVTVFLVANHSKAMHKSIASSGGLFLDTEPAEVKTTLIKEHRKVDYLIKIEKDVAHYPLQKMRNQLNEIPQVISVYPIDSLSIRNTDYLIFE